MSEWQSASAVVAGAAFVASLGIPSMARAAITFEGGEFEVDTNTAYTYSSVERTRSVSRYSDGTFVVVWSRGGGIQTIIGQRYDADGIRIGSEFQIADSTVPYLQPYARKAAIAHDPDGSFLVVWEGRPAGSPQGAGSAVLGQRFTADATRMGTEFQIDTNAAPVPLLSQPDLAALGSGRFVVVWDSVSAPEPYTYSYSVFGQRVDTDGSKLGTEFQVNTDTAQRNTDPEVDAADDGNFVVVWARGDYFTPGTYRDVFGQRFAANGAKTGSEFQVNTFTPYSEDHPALAVHGDGAFVVVWTTQYGDDHPAAQASDHSITVRRYSSSGAPLGDEEHINLFSAGNQVDPAIAMNDDGSFVVVWESASAYLTFDPRDDSLGGVFGRCFDATGIGGNTEFHVNTYTPGRDTDLSVAGDGGGNFVVVWNRSEDYYGIPVAYGRRMSIQGSCDEIAGGGVIAAKSDAGHRWGQDSLVPYDITVTNTENTMADVTITERVPIKSSFDAAGSTPGWLCTPDSSAGSMCTFTVQGLAPQALQVVRFAATVDSGTSPLWRLYNAVAVSSPGVQTEVADDATEYGACENLFDASFCTLVCYFVPQVCAATSASNALARARASSNGFVPLSTLRLRDEVLSKTRGGQRLIDLYYQQSTNAVMAAMSDPGLASLYRDFATQMLEPTVMAVLAGDGATTIFTQAQIDSTMAFLNALRAAAGSELAGVLDRELARVNVSGWAGRSASEGLAEFEKLTCEGFETELFCGELSYDCTVTATDALLVLKIAVGSGTFRPEADVDGSGSVVATDALQTLRIAVGSLPNSTACNP